MLRKSIGHDVSDTKPIYFKITTNRGRKNFTNNFTLTDN